MKTSTIIIIIASIIVMLGCITLLVFLLKNKNNINIPIKKETKLKQDKVKKNKIKKIKEIKDTNDKVVLDKLDIKPIKEKIKIRDNKCLSKKLTLIILISIITILAILQTILLATLILSFIAHALAVPTTLLTIITICIYFKKDKYYNLDNDSND